MSTSRSNLFETPPTGTVWDHSNLGQNQSKAVPNCNFWCSANFFYKWIVQDYYSSFGGPSQAFNGEAGWPYTINI